MGPTDTSSDKEPHTPEGWQTLRRFLPYLWPKDRTDLRIRIVIALTLVLIAKATVLALPYAYRAAVDAMTTPTNAVAMVAISFVIAYSAGRFASVAFDNIRNMIFERVGQDATRQFAEDVFRRLHQLSLRFHLSRRTGEITKTVERGTKSIDTMLYFLLFNIAPTLIELIAVAVIFYLNFGIGLVLATGVTVVAYIAVTQMITEWRTKLRREMNDLDGHALARAVDSLLNYETVKYFNNERYEAEVYDRDLDDWEQARLKNRLSLAALNSGQALIIGLAMIVIMAMAVREVASGEITLGDFTMINAYLLQLFIPLNALGFVYREIRQALVNVERLFKLLGDKPAIEDAPDATKLAVDKGEVQFDHIHFAYRPDRPILRDVSFSIPAGHTVAVVGASGAGKSTLARLLFRFYEVDQGAIRIDGQDIRTVTQDSLRSAIGVVPQDTVLFNDTLYRNLAYGRPEATEEEVYRAARMAHLEDFIHSLPEGYETKVGERGLKLSGGEKQRVAIARVILKNPPLLILDEATSSLDSLSEQAILGALNEVSQQRTTLVIAHRLSTIRDANTILVMDGGRIVESGSHGKLLAAGGHYAQLWAQQHNRDETGHDDQERTND